MEREFKIVLKKKKIVVTRKILQNYDKFIAIVFILNNFFYRKSRLIEWLKNKKKKRS